MKIALVTCYGKYDEYVRARTLRLALEQCREVRLLSVRNTTKSVLRYPQVAWLLLRTRLRDKPDVYVLPFRAYELLPLTLLLAGRKPILYDEFINPIEWVVYEHHKFGLTEHNPLVKAFGWWYRRLLNACYVVLTDTQAHAELSAKIMDIRTTRFKALPVSTDESVFYPRVPAKPAKRFTVFYYGTMLPLHGLGSILEAALLLKSRADIRFELVGGKPAHKKLVQQAIAKGARIDYRDWVPFERLPQHIARAGVTLGGPFGNTIQAQHVINGKTYQFMACGAPVIVGRTKVHQHFTDKQNCLIVPQADPAALAAAITWAAGHPKQLRAIGQAGLVTYHQHFSIEAITWQLQAVVDTLANKEGTA